MLSGIDGIMNLAAASGEDLASTSDIVTDALTALGMQAGDSAHFADILAIAASNSNTSVAMMGETFKYAAPMMGAMGYTAEDAAIAIGMMANAGIKASSAGTALRAGLVNLAKPTQQMQDAMDKYGISLTDSSGQMLSLRDLIAELREKMGGLSEVEQTAAAGAIFGKNALSGWLAIINGADSDLDKLTNAIDNCQGAAQDMANTRLDNLNGDLTLMDSAWQGLETTIGEKFQPVLRDLVQTGTELIGIIDKFIQDHPGVVEGVTAFIGVVGTATAALTAFNAVSKLAAALSAAAILPAAPILAGVAAVGALTAGIVAYVAATDDGVPSVKELTEASQDLEGAMDDAQGSFDETAADIETTAGAADMYISKLEELEAQDVKPNTEEWDTWLNTLQLLTNAVPELADQIDLETGVIKGGTEALRENVDAWKEQAEAAAYQELINELMGDYNGVVKEMVGNQMKLTDNEIKLESANKRLTDAQQKLKDMTDDVNNGVSHSAKEFSDVQQEIRSAGEEVQTLTKEHDNLTQAIGVNQQALSDAEAQFDEAKGAIDRLTGANEEAANSTDGLGNSMDGLNGLIDVGRSRLEAIAEAYQDAYDNAQESLQGQWDLWEQTDEIVPKSIDDIIKGLESQTNYLQTINGALETCKTRFDNIDGADKIFTELYNAAMAGDSDAAGYLISFASSSESEVKKAIEKMQENQEEIDKTAGEYADLATGATESFQTITDEYAGMIDGMDMSFESARAARETFQAFTDEIYEQMPALDAAIALWNEKVAGAARNSMPYYTVNQTKTSYSRDSNGRVTARTDRKTTQPTVKGTGDYLRKDMNFQANASGTESALEGWSIVGEAGPEIILAPGAEMPPILNNRISVAGADLPEVIIKDLIEQSTAMPEIKLPGPVVNVPPGPAIKLPGPAQTGAPQIIDNTQGPVVIGPNGPEIIEQPVNLPGISLPESVVNVPPVPDINLPELAQTGIPQIIDNTQGPVVIEPNGPELIEQAADFPSINLPDSVVNVPPMPDINLPELGQTWAPQIIDNTQGPVVIGPNGPELIEQPVNLPGISLPDNIVSVPPMPDISLPGLPSTVAPQIIDNTQGPVIVGKDGPELVYLQGGEKIYNASQTSLIQRQAERESERILQFAAGTASAPAGYALTGEHGPELIMPSSAPGIQEIGAPDVSVNVAPAPVRELTPATYATHSVEYTVTVSPSYTINGGSGTDEIRRVVSQSVMDLRGQIEDVLRDIKEDQMRGAYV